MKLVQIRSFSGRYSVQIKENTDQKKLGIWTLFAQWGLMLIFFHSFYGIILTEPCTVFLSIQPLLLDSLRLWIVLILCFYLNNCFVTKLLEICSTLLMTLFFNSRLFWNFLLMAPRTPVPSFTTVRLQTYQEIYYRLLQHINPFLAATESTKKGGNVFVMRLLFDRFLVDSKNFNLPVSSESS